MQGLALLKILIESTGLPPESVERELNRILAKGNFAKEELTLDDVRELIAAYLQDVLVEAKESTSAV